MKRRHFILAVCAVLTMAVSVTGAVAQDSLDLREKGGILFLNTDPIGATVVINGSPMVETTPILLRDLEPGTYTVELRKEGYRTFSSELDIEVGSPVVRNVRLDCLSFMPLFLGEDTIVFNGTPAEASENGVLLETGTYSFRRSGGTLFIDPIYPKQGLMNALTFSLPVLTVLSCILTLNDVMSPQTAQYLVSPSVMISWGITFSAATADLFLLGDKQRYVKAAEATILDAEDASFESEAYFERGERMLSLGNLAEALEYYTVILERFPESSRMPEALYKISKIHSITGETAMAVAEMELILDSYPVPETYDKTCQNLAVLHFRKGDFEKSLSYLDTMVFVDPLFSREEVAYYGSDILKVWSESGKEEAGE